MLANNKIALLGKVVTDWKFDHRMLNEDFYNVKLQVIRDSGNLDEIPLIVSKRLFTKELEEINGKAVYVNGSIRTYNLYEGVLQKLRLFVFVDEIQFVDSSDDIIEINDSIGTVSSNNWVSLTGTICKRSSFRETPGGRQLVDIILAVNRDFGKTDYIPCIFWGRNGKYVSNLDVGTYIELRGRLQSRIYVKHNESHETYEVSADQVFVIEGDDVKNVGFFY